jgi:hypothetical protein
MPRSHGWGTLAPQNVDVSHPASVMRRAGNGRGPEEEPLHRRWRHALLAEMLEACGQPALTEGQIWERLRLTRALVPVGTRRPVGRLQGYCGLR